jgi:hypothetical protein
MKVKGGLREGVQVPRGKWPVCEAMTGIFLELGSQTGVIQVARCKF